MYFDVVSDGTLWIECTVVEILIYRCTDGLSVL